MTKTTRKLKGWPPGTDALAAPATATELARARQTGLTVRELRQEQLRADAAEELSALLNSDEQDKLFTVLDEENGLTTRQRWALHMAVGCLKSRCS